ncbi:trypsin-like serine protease [Roseateles microcysteis]|uniref:trypsin-like serine protease n=1 Tax=Roseateles microcysteis TaxID=3119057 RepID=UPI002FE533C0
MINKRTALVAALAAAALAAANPALALDTRTVSGSYGDLSWSAQSNIVGVTSTATGAAGGDPRYFAPMPQYSGVATLIMNYGAAGSFICTGSLMEDRRTILTAAHCVSDGSADRPLSTTVYFYNGTNPDTVPLAAPSFSYAVSNYKVHSAYTGHVIDQNDIAVLTLDNWVDSSISTYDLYTSDLTGQGYNIAGYGGRSNTGGTVGTNLGTGRLRQGDNRYDFRMGDDDFLFPDGHTVWSDVLGEPSSQIEYTYLADFDNGQDANDASCRTVVLGLGLPASGKYCDLGVGADEVSSAGGDSGGPEFVDGKVASVTSFGLSFGGFYGDINPGLNSSFGEFNGFVPTSIHADFIRSSFIPEPASMALVGLGLLGLGLTRRKKQQG